VIASSTSVESITFKYDPFRRRIYKSSSSATSIYAYDGDNLIEETNSSGAEGTAHCCLNFVDCVGSLSRGEVFFFSCCSLLFSTSSHIGTVRRSAAPEIL
jgi:hypothetical protein